MAITSEQLLARIRELVATHTLTERAAGGASSRQSSIVRSRRHASCGEPDAAVAYFLIGGRVAHLNAAHDALWKTERKTGSEG